MDIENKFNVKELPSEFLGLNYHGLAIQVVAEDYKDLIWLNEFLCPQFQISSNSFWHCRVFLISDDEIFDYFYSTPPPQESSQVAFILDKKAVKLPVWESSPGNLILFDEGFHTFYCISQRKPEVYIVANSDNGISSRFALMRVVREIAMCYAKQVGVFAHASAFLFDHFGFVIAGPENAGKTSLLLYFLLNAPTKFISNDRLLVYPDGDELSIKGMPTIITFSPQTARMFPSLSFGFLSKCQFGLTLDEVFQTDASSKNQEGNEEFRLSQRQFCRLLGVESVAGSKLSVILFPRLINDPYRINISKLGAAKKKERLSDAKFAKHVKETLSVFDINGHDHNRSSGAERSVPNAMAHLPCFDCFLGQDAYQSRTSALELINCIIEQI